MNQVDVTWLRAFKVCWSLFWRVIVYLLAPCAVLSFLILEMPNAHLLNFADLLYSSPLTPAPYIVLGVLGLAIGILLGTLFVKIVLGKAYSDFRIVLEGPPRRYKIEPRL